MKLNKKALKSLINEALNDFQEKSMLLKVPLEEMATAGSVANRINVPMPSQQPEGFSIGNTGRIVNEFLIISADRGSLRPKKKGDKNPNKERYKEMLEKITAAGFPFTELEGGWEETEKATTSQTKIDFPNFEYSPETEKETGNKKAVVENSVIVYNEPRGPAAEPPSMPLKDLGMTLALDYEQESFIFGQLATTTSGEVHRIVKAYGPNGVQQGWLNATSMEKVPEDAAFWSRVRRKGPKTQLKEEEIVEIEAPNSVIEAMRKASEHKGKKIKFVRRKD